MISVSLRSSAIAAMAGRFTFAQAALALVIALFLLVFLVVPIFTVIYVAFTSNGSFTLAHFQSFFHLTLMREAFYNSLYVGGMSVVISSILALPLAAVLLRLR